VKAVGSTSSAKKGKKRVGNERKTILSELTAKGKCAAIEGDHSKTCWSTIETTYKYPITSGGGSYKTTGRLTENLSGADWQKAEERGRYQQQKEATAGIGQTTSFLEKKAKVKKGVLHKPG